MKAPEIIFLQWHGDCHPEDCCADDDVDPSGASWCWEQVFPADIEYIRMDKLNAVKRQRDQLLAALKEVRDLGHNYTQVSHRVWIIADAAITKAESKS